MQNSVDMVWLASQFPDLQNITPLSMGGQKLVFSATHPIDGEVVLKIIYPNQDVQSIYREFLAVQQINGQRIPPILQLGKITTQVGLCFWFREMRVPGETVYEMLKRGPLPTTDLLRLGLDILETLAKAEEVKIVHRDVKPQNIIRDPNGNFWLIDFGIARHLMLSSLTATAMPFGKCTPGYAPPEQSRNIKDVIFRVILVQTFRPSWSNHFRPRSSHSPHGEHLRVAFFPIQDWEGGYAPKEKGHLANPTTFAPSPSPSHRTTDPPGYRTGTRYHPPLQTVGQAA